MIDSSPRRLLQVLLAAVAASAFCATTLFLVEQYDVKQRGAGLHAADTARLMEEHVRRVLRATDFILDEAGDLVRHPPPGQAARQARLDRLAAALPENGAVWLIDADGNGVVGNVSSTYWFAAHRDGAVRIIGPVTRPAPDAPPVFTVSRRITDDHGHFLGVAVAGIDATYFTDFHAHLALGEHGTTGVYDLHGRLILRQPLPGDIANANLTGGALLPAARAAPHGVVQGISPIDGVERVIAWRTLSDIGIIVTAGTGTGDALAGWRRTAWGLALAGVLLTLILGAIAVVAFRSLNRERAVLAGLEETVEQRTREANRGAQEARQAVDDKVRFVAAVSHDLRQPLQAAGLFAHALTGRVTDPALVPIVTRLQNSIDATGTLLATLVDASTLATGKLRPDLETFAAGPLLSTLADQFAPQAEAKGLTLTVVPPSARIVSDRTLLERMLRNLLMNALRYTEQGGILVGARRRGGSLAIQVVDTGIGISPDRLRTLLNGRPTEGGFGLEIVHRTAALLGHGLDLRSNVGHGTVVTITVPMQ